MRARILIACITLFLGLSCTPSRHAPVFPLDQIREGDLAFRCGRGVFSRAVTSAEEDGRYSHVGIIVMDDGKWKVVHAVPGEPEFKGDFDRVKIEDLDVFYGPDRAWCGELAHTGLIDSASVRALCRDAIQAARDSVRFDNDYSLEDSSEVYCTEFVWRLYRRRGIDLSEGRRQRVNTLFVKGDVILPEHLFAFSENEFYFCF